MALNSTNLAVAILAAGKGKRMGNPDTAKVMTLLKGQPLIQYVMDQTAALNASKVVVIVGHQKQAVQEFVSAYRQGTYFVEQTEQLGTGHAVMQTKALLDLPDLNVLILSGDVPLLSSETLADLLNQHVQHNAAATVLSTSLSDPTGYGRVVTSANNEFEKIVEHKDASPAELLVSEINSGVYVVKARDLFHSLSLVSNSNAQGEYYLTDIIKILKDQSKKVIRVHTNNEWEVQGINTPADLLKAEGYVV